MNSDHYQTNIAYWKSVFKNIPKRLFHPVQPDKSYKPTKKYHGKFIYVKASASQSKSDIIEQWQGLSVDGVSIISVMGDHYDMLKQPCVEQIGNLLRLNSV